MRERKRESGSKRLEVCMQKAAGGDGPCVCATKQLVEDGARRAARYLRSLRVQGRERKESNLQLDSKQILSLFFDPAKKLYLDIEAVLSVMARACVSQGVEAVVESWVSVMENHASPVRCVEKY